MCSADYATSTQDADVLHLHMTGTAVLAQDSYHLMHIAMLLFLLR